MHPVRLDAIPAGGREEALEAGAGERAAVAATLGLVALDRLSAEAELRRSGADEVRAQGRVRARVVQACVVTDEPVPADLDEPFDILFRPSPTTAPDEEIELSAGECDVVFHEGGSLDLGAAAVDTLALALDPYPRAPGAEAALAAAGVKSEADLEAERRAASPFAVLKGGAA